MVKVATHRSKTMWAKLFSPLQERNTSKSFKANKKKRRVQKRSRIINRKNN